MSWRCNGTRRVGRGALVTTACLLLALVLSSSGRAAAERVPVHWVRCLGWGACLFRPADGPAERPRQVRLRGVGAAEWDGTCPREGPAAQALRAFLEGALSRAAGIELRAVATQADGTWFADVWVDGIPLTEVLIHAGVGRTYAVDPDAGPCQ